MAPEGETKDNGWSEHKAEIFEKFRNVEKAVERLENAIAAQPAPGDSVICRLHNERVKAIDERVESVEAGQRKLAWIAGTMSGLGGFFGWIVGRFMGGA